MDEKDIAEQAYKNGYEAGADDGRKTTHLMEGVRTMTYKEKLVELLMQVEDNMCDDCGREPVGCAVVAIADHLIAHGVTVQEWISVKDRLPEKNDYYLCCVKSFCFPGRTYINILDCDKNGFKEGHIYTDDVTHWMPLPQPPKGEPQ